MSEQERINHLLNYLKDQKIIRNQQDFVERIDENTAVVSNYVNGKRSFSNNFISKVCKTFDFVSEEWLLTGEGEMLKTQTNLKNRLDIYLKHLGVSGREFEKLCELVSGSYSGLGDGISARILNKISIKCPDLDMNWLINGKGEMLKTDKSAIADNSDNYNITDRLLSIIESQQRTIENLSNK